MTADAAIDADTVLFTTTLRPHRSANHRVLGWLLGLLALAFIATGIGFSLIGAWPVTGFLGLEIVLLAGALYLNLFAGRAFEAIDLTADELRVRRVDHWGRERRWSFQPHWLQVNITPMPHGLDRLEVRTHGRSLVIGHFLTPEERRNLFEALRNALSQLVPRHAAARSIVKTGA